MGVGSIVAGIVIASVMTMAYGQSEDHGCRGPEDVINKCIEDFNNNRASIRAGTFRNATDYIRDMFIFNDVCMRYIQLEVIEEVEKCLTIYQEYNGYMGQLWQNHNETITKNLVIGNETGVWYERIPPLE